MGMTWLDVCERMKNRFPVRDDTVDEESETWDKMAS